MTRSNTPTENSKKQSDNTKTTLKNFDYTTIGTNLGPSVDVLTATQLVWLNRFSGSLSSNGQQKLCYQRDTLKVKER